MIAYVKGVIEEITEDNVVIDVGGIGYNVKISARESQLLPKIGETVKLHTYTLVREDAFLLYGFLTLNELDIFKKCITVNGIGPKGALAILSAMDADSLRYAILAGDAKAISKAPGIGARTAERLILDLKDKISLGVSSLDIPADNKLKDDTTDKAVVMEAVEALVALGYGQTESLRAVREVEGSENMDSSELLKQALKKLF